MNSRLIVFITILSVTKSLFAEPSVADIQKGIDLSLSQQYDEALALFASMKEQFPEHPAGAFFSAAIWHTRLMDFETKKWEKNFYKEINLAIKSAQSNLAKNPTDSRMLFYLGAALGYKSFQLARNKKYIPAIQLGLQTVKKLQQAIEADSLFSDPYLGIGTYLYWRSNLTKKMSWLPFFEDQRSHGIDMISQAAKNGIFSKWAALSNLAWIYIEERQYDRASNCALEGLEFFPNSRFFLWPLAEAQFQKRDYEQAITVFSKLLASVQNGKENNGYNEILIQWKLAQCYYRLGDKRAARSACEMLLSTHADKEVRNRADEKKKKAEKLLEEISDSR
jgi:tetratricopeptide (TPR) repeat protein